MIKIIAICAGICFLIDAAAYAAPSLRVNSMFDGINKIETAKRLEKLFFEMGEAKHNNDAKETSDKDSLSEKINIKIVDPSEYELYTGILAEIAKEECIEYNKISGELSLTADFFYAISKQIEWGYGHALFIATDYKGEVVGANIIYKLRYLEKAGLEAITGSDVVRNEYQRKNIGIALRKAAFKWMIDKGYYIYMAIISKDNIKSLTNLQKVCRESGFTIQNVSKDKDAYEQYYLVNYLVDLSGPAMPLQILGSMKVLSANP